MSDDDEALERVFSALEAEPAADDAAHARRLRVDEAVVRRCRAALRALETGDPSPEGIEVPAWRPRPGERVGSYELLEPIGRGGMGQVWRARDLRGAREVAIKVAAAAVAAQALRRLAREAEVAARLRHPGLVAVHAAGQVRGTPWLAMELVEGCRGLDEAFLERGLLERVALVRDAARALGHAHAQGVVHRDVKPQNILVDGTGRVRVADFGLALAEGEERLTRSGVTPGTPTHMAPEQLRGSQIGPATDVWGLGVVLYQALTGTLPFDGETPVELMTRILHGAPEPPRARDPSLPPGLEAICLAALAPEPASRPDDGEALARELDRALGGEPARPRPARRMGPLLVLVLLAGGAVGGAALLATRAGPGPDPAPIREAPLPRAELEAWLSCDGDPAAVAATSRALLAHEPLAEPVRTAVAAGLGAMEARYVAQALGSADGDLRDFHARLGPADEALAALGEAAGVGSAARRALRKEALDRSVEEVRRQLRAAIARDRARPHPHPDDVPDPIPAVKRCLARLRVLLAGETPGPRLANALHEAVRELEAATRADDPIPRPRDALTLLALESYRFYWLDPNPQPIDWLPFLEPGVARRSGWYQLVAARIGMYGIDPGGLPAVDPELLQRCPRSRLLSVGALGRLLESTPDASGEALPLARRGLGLDPGALDELAGGGPIRRAADGRTTGWVLSSLVLGARRLRQRGESERPLLEAWLPLLEPALGRFQGEPTPVRWGPVQAAATLLRELGLARGEEAAIRVAIELRRSLLPGTDLDDRHAIEVSLQLAQDLVARIGLVDPAAKPPMLREAIELARAGLVRAENAHDEQVRIRAAVVLTHALLASSAADPAVDAAELERLLVLASAEGEETADRSALGLFGLTHGPAAARRGDPREARARLERAIERSRRYPEWGTLPALQELERRLPR